MPIDYKKYPSNWKSEIRPRILERDKNCCKVCGVENGILILRDNKDKEKFVYWPEGIESEAWSLDGLKSTKVVLTIAHLDHDTKNNEDSNLAALCQLHHLRLDINHHKKNSRETIRKKKKLQNLF